MDTSIWLIPVGLCLLNALLGILMLWLDRYLGPSGLGLAAFAMPLDSARHVFGVEGVCLFKVFGCGAERPENAFTMSLLESLCRLAELTRRADRLDILALHGEEIWEQIRRQPLSDYDRRDIHRRDAKLRSLARTRKPRTAVSSVRLPPRRPGSGARRGHQRGSDCAHC